MWSAGGWRPVTISGGAADSFRHSNAFAHACRACGGNDVEAAFAQNAVGRSLGWGLPVESINSHGPPLCRLQRVW